MSEDDRAAKAARAKAMLNRRRQQKAGTPQMVSPESSAPLVSQIPSRTNSPAPSEPPNSEKRRDVAELFSKADLDGSWVSALPRATSPQKHVEVAPETTNGKDYNKVHNVQAGNDAQRLREVEAKFREVETRLKAELAGSQQLIAQHEQEGRRLELLLDNERQAVTLLVSEKSNLSTELHRLREVESKAREYESVLGDEQKNANNLKMELTNLRSEYQTALHKLQYLEAREKELNDKSRDQERQLQLTIASTAELQEDLEGTRRRVKELEEQISSDDRAERLEESLKNTQDRADELEFQLSKLRQSQATLKAGYDELEHLCHTLQSKESDLEQKNSDLQEDCRISMQELARVTSERDALVAEKLSLRTQVGKGEHSIQELRRMLDQASSELSVQTRQLQTLQSELRVAVRRADEAERIQKDLQLEGTNLMRLLDEMRPKIIELTSEKLNLSEKVESLQNALQNSEVATDELKSSLEDARSQVDQTNQQWQLKWAQRDKEQAQTLAASSDMHTAYAELQSQLNNALQSLRNLESQRGAQHHELVRNTDEIGRLNATSETQREALLATRKELEMQRLAQEQQRDLLDQARNEIESLQSKLDVKEQELRSHSTSDKPRSLNDEFLDSLRQQHALDLSAAQSQIRALEDSVFSAEAKAHTLQKQVVFLEDKLRHGRINRSFSPMPSRPASRNEADLDLRRSSFGSHRTTNLAPSSLSRATFDHELSPETRHKRKISLAMLKARIDSEIAGHPPSRALSPVRSLPDSSRPVTPASEEVVHRRPQFLDDSHVFWCSSCRGDLVIL